MAKLCSAKTLKNCQPFGEPQKNKKSNTQGQRKKQWQTSHRYKLIDIEISYRLYKWAWLENRFANFTILLATPRQTYKCQQIFNDFIKMANPFSFPSLLPVPVLSCARQLSCTRTNPSSYTICISCETTTTTSINGRYKCFPFVSVRRVLLFNFFANSP